MDTSLSLAACAGMESQHVAPKGWGLETHVKGAALGRPQGMPKRVVLPRLPFSHQGYTTKVSALSLPALQCSAQYGLGLGLLYSHWLHSQVQGSMGLQNDRRTDGQTTNTGQALAWAWPLVGTEAWATGSRSLASG